MYYCIEYTGEICITVLNTQVKYVLLYKIIFCGIKERYSKKINDIWLK